MRPGHVIVATALGEEVHRVSVVTRGHGLGATSLTSDRDAVLLTAADLFDQLIVAISGRCAEELLLTPSSTGSEADLKRATGYARDMVTRYGMADGYTSHETPRARSSAARYLLRPCPTSFGAASRRTLFACLSVPSNTPPTTSSATESCSTS